MLVGARLRRPETERPARPEAAGHVHVPLAERGRHDRAGAVPLEGQVLALPVAVPPARVPLQVDVVGGDQDRPPVPFEGDDVEQVLRHQRIPDGEQTTDALRLGARHGHRAVVGEQADSHAGEDRGAVPGLQRRLPDQAGRVDVQLCADVLGDTA